MESERTLNYCFMKDMINSIDEQDEYWLSWISVQLGYESVQMKKELSQRLEKLIKTSYTSSYMGL